MGPKFKTTKKRQDLADRYLQNGSSSASSASSETLRPPTSSTISMSPVPALNPMSQTSQKSSSLQSPASTPASSLEPSPPSDQTPPLASTPPFESNPVTLPNPGSVPSFKPSSNHKSASSPMPTPISLSESSPKLSNSISAPNLMPAPSQIPTLHKEKNYVYKATVADSTFTWDRYLQLKPAKIAPKEAFRQATVLPKNYFTLGMKLEAKDPRNSSNWCLASVVSVEGLHLRLRFVGADKMNDLYEIIDSENIRPVGSCPSELLLAPTGFTGNIASYPKFVEKVLRDESSIIAPPEYFPPTPSRPKKNLFESGMKLEAVDLKNRDYICPATIGAVIGSQLLITFDGWRGSFDYKCDYFSRDLFPINWCRDVGRAIQPPQGWQNLLDGKSLPAWSPPATPTISPNKSQPISPSKRPRGRPKKDVIKETKKIARDHASLSRDGSKFVKEKPKSSNPLSSTPKKLASPDIQESFAPSTSSTPDDGSISRSDLIDDGQNINRFQCQRTVSFDEWQRRRKIEEQMPHEIVKSSDADDTKNYGDIGMNLSDTGSMASTLSSTNNKDSSEIINQKPSLKKFKTDFSEATGDTVTIPMELRDLLEIKPNRLSLWSVQDVLDILKTESTLSKYVETFQENEIDGKAFELFDEKKRDLLMSMGLKLGPVLKVLNLREQVEQCLNEKNCQNLTPAASDKS